MASSHLNNAIFQLHKAVRWAKDNGWNNTTEVPGERIQLDKIENKDNKFDFLF